MATIPTPRSYAQALGDLIDVFLSKQGFRGLKAGGFLLSLFEAAAQSDVRSSSDIFALLAAITLSNAKGAALDRIGADERIGRTSASRASTFVTITDTSFQKVASRIYQGKPAPVAGSAVVYVVDGSSFPATGSLYIGRDTTNLEGPLPYTAVTNMGSYFAITLTGATTKFHNLAETVTLARGGDRRVAAGQNITTTANGSAPTVSFSTLDPITLLDGETAVDNIRVVADQAGIAGNVPANSLVSLSPSPFTGAAVVNPLPVTNGCAVEEDDSYRERIRSVRASRSKGISLALKTGLLGLVAPDSSSRIVSANVVVTRGEPTTLYIDDGTGYEEQTDGVATETVVANAVGGEQRFALTGGRPLAKAFVATTLPAPFAMVDGCSLSVKVGGALSRMTFTADQFRDVSNATAYEVVAAINSTYTLPFAARTVGGGSGVAIFAKGDSQEDVQVSAPATGTDANLFLGFGVSRVDSLRLYKNDALLYKDGLEAAILTTDYSTWNSAIQAGDTFIYTVDGTVQVTWTLADADFVNAGTGYTVVSASNPLAAWAAVFNYKLPGITATVESNRLRIVSNLGPSSRASLSVNGASTLISRSMFDSTSLTATGRTSDYTLDRNLAQIKLAAPLAAGDALTAATPYTRAYLTSSSFSTITVPALDTANMWFVIDGAAKIISTGVSAQTAITMTKDATISSFDLRTKYAAVAGTFSNVLAGDWLIIYTKGTLSTDGTARVAQVAGDGSYVIVESVIDVGGGTTVTTFPNGGFTFVRAAQAPQRIVIAAGAQSPDSIADAINHQIVGATASVYRTNRLRVTTQTFASNGEVALVLRDANAALIPLLPNAVQSQPSHIAYVETARSDTGTPTFDFVTVNTPTGLSFTVSDTSFSSSIIRGQRLSWLRPLPNTTYAFRDEANRGTRSMLLSASSSVQTMKVRESLAGISRNARAFTAVPYSMGPQDTLNVVLDGDVFSKNYLIPMARDVKPTSSSSWNNTQASITELDGSSLSGAFGTAFDFTDFRLHLRAQTITNPPASADVSTSAVLWRSTKYGRDGEQIRVSYTNPTAPSQGYAVSAVAGDVLDVSVRLPSSAARTPTIGQKFAVTSADVSGTRTITYYSGVRASTTPGGTNTIVVTMTGMPAAITDHRFIVGDVVMVWGGTNCPNGLATVTNVASTTVFTVQYQGGLTTTAGGAETLNVTSTVGAAPSVPLSMSTVAVGDIATMGALTKLAAGACVTGRVYAVDPSFGQWYQIKLNASGSAVNSAYAEIVASSNLQFYPLNTALTNTSGSANLATRVNALNNPYVIAAIPVYTYDGVAQNGVPVALSTWDNYNITGTTPASGYQMTSGTRHIASSSYSAPNYTLQILETSIPGSGVLHWATTADWANETAKLVPVGAAALSRYFNLPSITGFTTNGEVAASSATRKLQIATGALGSGGSVQVLGGTANAARASIVGYALATTTGCVAQIRKTDAAGLFGGIMVAVEATQALPKTTNWTTSSTFSTSTATSTTSFFTVGTAGSLGKYSGSMTTSVVASKWRFERHGDFTCMVYTDTGTPVDWSAVVEGDYVRLQKGINDVSTANVGIFRIVRTNYAKRAIWFENQNSVEEDVTVANVEFFDSNSAMPGDQIVINASALNNTGTWTVTDITVAFDGTIATVTVSGSLAAVGPVALGAAVSLVQVLPARPSRFIKQVAYVADDTDDDYAHIVFTTKDGYTRINQSAGCVVTALDKLAFPTTTVTGLDGYRYSTGLIGEANRVVYGVTSDEDTYPGIAAAGAKINIQGPLVRRVQVGLSIRIQQGADPRTAIERVQSAVASVINKAGVGEAVDLAAVVRAARNVLGVTSVVVTSPTYNATNDLISVQPYEKPMVLDLDTDVLVTLSGT